MLNGCLDTAIAEAVTEHARITAEARSHEEYERSGQLAHETRDLLNTAILAYHALKPGLVANNGSTGPGPGPTLLGLPVWAGNLVPALFISAFGFALLQRDGLAILIGWIAIALIVVAGLLIWLTWTWVSPYSLRFWAWLNGLLPDAWGWLTGLFGG